ncbi:MAG: hypothetical protein HZA90_13605 [Verrucomicrobia bacterium]|nr:hypothetical protein [Verrucomicrobiota bacterium]
MKTKYATLVAVLTLGGTLGVWAQGTAFTYQGRLANAGVAANGQYDLRFVLFDQASAGVQVGPALTNSAVLVSNGLVTATLDFGAGAFTGGARWLEVAVRPSGSGDFSALDPRQALTPTPYAVFAAGANAAGLSGTLAPANIGAGTITSNALADGAVTASKLALGAVSSLGAADGSPAGAVTVNSNGLVGIGTATPVAGLHINSSQTILSPTLLSELLEDLGARTNREGEVFTAISGGLLALGYLDDDAVGLWDVSDPRWPTALGMIENRTGSFTNLAGASGVALSGQLLAMAAFYDGAVTLADVSAPATPAWRSTLRDGEGGFDELDGATAVNLTGHTLAVAAFLDDAVTLVDVSNPAAPVLQAVLKDGAPGFHLLGGAVALARQGGLLAIAAYWDNAVTLVDVSTPTNPVLRASLEHGQGAFTALDGVWGVAISGNVLAIAARTDSAVTLVDISNPADPVFLATLKDGQAGFDSLWGARAVAFQGNTLWIAAEYDNALTAVDVSQPSAPVLKAVVHNSQKGFSHLNSVQNLSVAGNLVVAGGIDAVTLLDGTTTAQAGLVSDQWVAIGTSAPQAPLHVRGDVLVEGARLFDVNATRVQLGQSMATGFGATAMGDYSLASGEAATAMGGDSWATGDYATAMGDSSTASGYAATAMGSSTASGEYATAMGDLSLASGYGSTAMGSSVASGPFSAAIGSATARGPYSFAQGYDTLSDKEHAVAIGDHCIATNEYSWAIGHYAISRHAGSFVWGDSVEEPFSSTASNQVSFRCSGGVRFTSGGVQLAQTVSWMPGSSSWTFSSDRNLKEAFVPADTVGVLEKVCRVPVSEWNFKGHATRHLGPMAQDFREQFQLGNTETALDSGDLHGVTLAALQGLNQKLEAQIKAKDAEVQALQRRLAALEEIIRQLAK